MLLKNSGLRLLLAFVVCSLATALTMADVTAPARIGDLVVDKPGADAALSWSAVTLDAAGNLETVASYNIYRGETRDFVQRATTSIAGKPGISWPTRSAAPTGSGTA